MYALVACMVVIVMSVGILLGAYAENQHRACEEGRERQVAAARVLPRIIKANDQDGDTHQAQFWRDYFAELRKTPPVDC